jgi:hypothetical protein
MKLQAQVAIGREDKIRWLVIEPDEKDTKGYFLYYHVNDDFAYDSWFKTIDEVFQAAQTQYGILKEDWIAIQ